MMRSLWLLMVPALIHAADDQVTRGASVYRTTCAVSYCHGPEGRAGRAPALAGRRFDPATVARIAAGGIPNTGMPSFGAQLKPEEIGAVAAYIVSLNATGQPEASKPAAPNAIPPAVQQGRALFFDAARTGACGSCHEVAGRGIPVSVALQDLKSAHVGDLRDIQTPNVMAAHPVGEDAFPAIVVEKAPSRVRVYDLSSRLPVLRTFAPADVTLTPNTSWRHTAASSLYTDVELEAVLGYLRWAAH
jgi:mono/diheme cytochrome c family protein